MRFSYFMSSVISLYTILVLLSVIIWGSFRNCWRPWRTFLMDVFGILSFIAMARIFFYLFFEILYNSHICCWCVQYHTTGAVLPPLQSLHLLRAECITSKWNGFFGWPCLLQICIRQGHSGASGLPSSPRASGVRQSLILGRTSFGWQTGSHFPFLVLLCSCRLWEDQGKVLVWHSSNFHVFFIVHWPLWSSPVVILSLGSVVPFLAWLVYSIYL